MRSAFRLCCLKHSCSGGSCSVAPQTCFLSSYNCSCRWYHPCPPTKTIVKAERTFEGISLDVPGQSSKTSTTLTRFQLCEECYQAEAR